MKLKSIGGGLSGIRLSITTKIAIALCLLITFLMSAVGVTIFLKDQALLKREFTEKGWNIVHTALPFTGNFIYSGNTEFLNTLVKKLGSYQDVSYAMVIDANGGVLAHTDAKMVGTWVSDEETKSAMSAKADVSAIRSDEQGQNTVMDFFSPVKSSNGSTIGYISMGVDLTGLNGHVKETTISLIIIILMAALTGIFLAALISKRILNKPLRDLTAATERLSTGDFSYKVPVHNKDELGDLATAFNTMTVHLANLIQSVKSSALDINKSAEQILGQLQTSDRTNNRLSQTFDIIKQGTEEQLDILKQSLDLSEQLSGQSKNVLDRVAKVVGEVNKASRAGESGVDAVSRIAASIDESGQSLESTASLLKLLEDRSRRFSMTTEQFAGLLERNTQCTVQIALLAARSGNEELTCTAEDLHRISEESNRQLSQMTAEIEEIQNAWCDAESALDEHIRKLGEGRGAVSKAGNSLEEVLSTLAKGKAMVDEAISTARQQSASIDEIRQSQSAIIDKLLKSVNKSSGAGSDTRVQTENLHDIDSLAKKLMRMVDRLNVLSLQFKV